ncbi:MAG: glycosyltransferase family 4 protein [Syntrophorhabdus sp.]|nr:glycosyltransferase family 4 protein [Syntrophorhabdus sp.]
MKLVYAIRHVGMTGGVKVFFQHVELLRSMGHTVHLLTRFIDEEWGFRVKPEVVPAFDEKTIPEADGIVVTTPKDVEELWDLARGRGIPLFHFLQGFEPDYVLERINGSVVPERFRGSGIVSRLKYRYKKKEWKARLKRFDRLYELPTVKIAIAPHLVRGVENRYHTTCYLLPNGIDQGVFHPKEKDLDYGGTLKILSVGNYNIEYKAIPDVLEAVRILKGQGRKVHLTRVSPADIGEKEKGEGVADRFLVRISEAEMADLYRESHILVGASTEIEGFGLPPVEAMSTGTPVILTRISPFYAFDDVHDFAYFVDVHRPQAIAQGIMDIAGNAGLREALVKRGFEVSARYRLSNVGKQLEGIVREHVRKG